MIGLSPRILFLLILPCRISAPEEGPNSLENALSQKTNRHLEYED